MNFGWSASRSAAVARVDDVMGSRAVVALGELRTDPCASTRALFSTTTPFAAAVVEAGSTGLSGRDRRGS